MRSFAPLVAVALASLAAGIATPAARDIGPYPGNEADPGYYFCSTTDCSGPQEGDDYTCSSVPFSSFPPGGINPCLGTYDFRSAGIYAPPNVTSLDFDVYVEQSPASGPNCGDPNSPTAVKLSDFNKCVKLPGIYNLMFVVPK